MLEIQAQTLFVASRTHLCGQHTDAPHIRDRRHPADNTMTEKVRLRALPDQTKDT